MTLGIGIYIYLIKDIITTQIQIKINMIHAAIHAGCIELIVSQYESWISNRVHYA